MSIPIIQISGVGAHTADILADHGYTYVEDLAATTVDALVRIPGFGPARAKLVIKAARDLVGAGTADPDSSPHKTPAVDTVDVFVVGDIKTDGLKKKNKKNKKKKKTKDNKKNKNEKKQKKEKKVKKTASKQKKQKKEKKKKKKK